MIENEENHGLEVFVRIMQPGIHTRRDANSSLFVQPRANIFTGTKHLQQEG